MRMRIDEQADYAEAHWTSPALPVYASRMSVLNENIAELLRRAKRQSDVAEAVGSNQSTVSRWAKYSKPEPESLLALARYAGVSVEMLVSVPIAEWPRGNVARPQVSAEDRLADDYDAVLLPEVAVVYSMGGGRLNEDLPIVQMVPFSRRWLETLTSSPASALMVGRGDGDSMMPTILDQDIVIIDRSENRFNKQDRIWALAYGEFGMIKRVRALPSGQFQINSDNPTVTPILATEDEVTFVGRVVGIIRRI